MKIIPVEKRKTFGRVKIQNKTNKLIKNFEGRWTIEEEKLFEKNYKDYLNKKITIKQLKKKIKKNL